jgi:hypothetical protein
MAAIPARHRIDPISMSACSCAVAHPESAILGSSCLSNVKRIYGDQWAKVWKDWIEHQRQQGRAQIHANDRQQRQAGLPPGYYAS